MPSSVAQRTMRLAVVILAALSGACGKPDVYLGSELGTDATAGGGGTGGTDAEQSDGAQAPEPSSAGTGSIPGNTGGPATAGTGMAGSSSEPEGCPTGWEDCDGDASNGCEIDVQTTVEHCGGCDAACPWRIETVGSRCEAGQCIPICEPRHENCDGSWTNGCEARLWVDRDNCGSCGVACTLLCDNGECR